MISRKSTTAIAHIYGLLAIEAPTTFHSSGTWTVENLCRFFYDEDYPEWFIKRFQQLESPDALDKFIRGLQSGSAVKNSFFNYRGNALEEGQAILKKLAINILGYEFNDDDHRDIGLMKNLVSILERQLELDGYIYKNSSLYPADSSVIDEEKEQGLLEQLSNSLALPDTKTITHHLNRSEEHYLEGKWDDSISNARKVLDAILTQVASEVYLKVNKKPIPPEMLKNATDIRTFLERQNLITKVEREALDKNYGALSATGGHPYIAEQDQARLMRHLALTFSQFVLLRYQGFLANP